MIIRQTAMESEEGDFDLELQRKQMLLIFVKSNRSVSISNRRDQRSVNGGCISGRRRPRGGRVHRRLSLDFFFLFLKLKSSYWALWAFNCLSLRLQETHFQLSESEKVYTFQLFLIKKLKKKNNFNYQ